MSVHRVIKRLRKYQHLADRVYEYVDKNQKNLNAQMLLKPYYKLTRFRASHLLRGHYISYDSDDNEYDIIDMSFNPEQLSAGPNWSTGFLPHLDPADESAYRFSTSSTGFGMSYLLYAYISKGSTQATVRKATPQDMLKAIRYNDHGVDVGIHNIFDIRHAEDTNKRDKQADDWRMRQDTRLKKARIRKSGLSWSNIVRR